MVVVGSVSVDGKCDVSPRGDSVPVARVLDSKTLVIAERRGNRRTDTLRNILETGRVGLLFLIPGLGETLRINGSASLTDDRRLLEPCTVQGRAPKIGILIAIKEAFMHCPKAFIRSGLWDSSRHIDRTQLASYAEMLLDHCEGLTDEDNRRQTEVMAERGLY